MDLQNWGGNLAAHPKCFPKLTDFFKIDKNLTDIWQFQNFIEFTLYAKGWTWFLIVINLAKIFKLSYLSQIFFNFEKVSEFWKAFFLNYKIPTLFFQIHEIFIESRRVFARPLRKIRKTQIFHCHFSKLHNSAKCWSFFKKLGSFELLTVWHARNWSYILNLVNYKPFYG